MPRPTHAQRLETWIGRDQVEAISHNMRDWYGPPIPIANVPGCVYAARGGDFVGAIRGGYFGSLFDYAQERKKRVLRNWSRGQLGKLHTGFSSLSDLISEATAGGKSQYWNYFKSGTGAVSGRHYSLWNVGSFPAAGAAPSARPGGSVPTSATIGAIPFTDPGGSDTLHFTTLQAQATAAPNTLMIYDRIFHAATISHTINTAQSVTGVPTRYATTTSPLNFAFLEVTTALGATASNVTMTYTDQSGNTAEAAVALAVIVSSVLTQIPHLPWFIPLNAGDTGCRTITNLTMSVANTVGVSNIVQGHPLCFVPQPVANSMVVMDGINSAFNLRQILAGSCLSFLEFKGVGTATSYSGDMTLVSG